MKLGLTLLGSAELLKEKGYSLPRFDVKAMRERTKRDPQWVHFGPGNIFRAFPARLQQELLNEGLSGTGIIALDARGAETIAKAYTPFDDLCVAVSLKNGGRVEKTIVASVAEACATVTEAGMARAREIFAAPGLMMCSFTVTEKGYAPSAYEADLARGPEDARTTMGVLTALLRHRMETCDAPLTLVSMDNCAGNGDRIRDAVTKLAEAWGDTRLRDWVLEKVSFPWSMIDKITPRPDTRVLELLKADGFEGLDPVVTSLGSYVAPFVNAEEKEYLVIEDDFRNGRPPLEKAGVRFASRETVEQVERMKVTTCLNPLHTALAVYGCVLGYDAIWKETQDAQLSALIRKIGYEEGLPVVTDPGIFSPKRFLDEVVLERLPNSFLPDTPQRIATDTSHKIPVRFGETVKAWVRKTGTAKDLVGVPLAIAGWLRYLDGTDDEGNAFACSDDPRMDSLKRATAEELCADREIMGCDLEAAGLTGKVLGYLSELRAGPGSVRAVLKKYLG